MQIGGNIERQSNIIAQEWTYSPARTSSRPTSAGVRWARRQGHQDVLIAVPAPSAMTGDDCSTRPRLSARRRISPESRPRRQLAYARTQIDAGLPPVSQAWSPRAASGWARSSAQTQPIATVAAAVSWRRRPGSRYGYQKLGPRDPTANRSADAGWPNSRSKAGPLENVRRQFRCRPVS